jgi:MoaA/NifB/PqqE/SkfB family radical SAM enzyme
LLKYKEIFLGNGNCNNECMHCLVRGKDRSRPGLNEIIDSLQERDADNVMFYGGEPTLRSDLPEIVRAARENGYRRIKLLTNGRAFSNMQLLQGIINAGCYLFDIKLWGSNPSLHDHLTGVSGSFWETMSGLENLAGHPHEKFVSVRVHVCKENYHDVENTVATALNFGVNRVILSVQDDTLPFQSALPHIRNAINISIFNRIWILTEFVPFCVMQGLEQHISEIYSGLDTIYEKTFSKHKYCAQCIYNELCRGFKAKYLEQFGHREFPPVKAGKYLQDIRNLYE